MTNIGQQNGHFACFPTFLFIYFSLVLTIGYRRISGGNWRISVYTYLVSSRVCVFCVLCSSWRYSGGYRRLQAVCVYRLVCVWRYRCVFKRGFLIGFCVKGFLSFDIYVIYIFLSLGSCYSAAAERTALAVLLLICIGDMYGIIFNILFCRKAL